MFISAKPDFLAYLITLCSTAAYITSKCQILMLEVSIVVALAFEFIATGIIQRGE